MVRRAEFSAQALLVLAALCAEQREWLHGYGIARDTGLKSGSLYPILIRLAERGLVEARWEEGQPAGRPRRHLYRLTPGGLASATAALASNANSGPGRGRRARRAPGGGAGGAVGGVTRVLAGLLRRSARLVPAERRAWAEALWAEAGQVPPGLARLAWRAGGVRLIAREALLARRASRALVFVAAAVWVVHVAWPGPAGNPGTGVNRLDVVTLLPVLAVLPLLAWWLFGPAAPGRMARVLRSGAYAAVLVLTLAKASVEQVADNPAIASHLSSDASVPVKTGIIYTWLVESVFLLVVGVYVAAILAATARRPRVGRATLAAGTGGGIVLGAVMYAVFPLGFAYHATAPWLHGLPIDLVVLLAWVLLFGGPVLAGAVAARCYRGPGSPEQVRKAKIRQAVVAGFLATAAGALMVAVLGTVTIALMPRAGWALPWLYPGQHLSAAVASNIELTACVRAAGYGLILLAFPVIGLIMGLAGGGVAAGPAAQPGPPPGGGPPRPPGHPAPDPPGGIRLAAAGADGLAASLPGFAGDSPDSAAPALPRAG